MLYIDDMHILVNVVIVDTIWTYLVLSVASFGGVVTIVIVHTKE